MSNLHSMKQAYEQVSRNAAITSRLQFGGRPGVGVVARETRGAWQIEVTFRDPGIANPRPQFSALLRHPEREEPETLSGFSTKVLAIAAARTRIDQLEKEKRDAAARSPHYRKAPIASKK